MIINGSKVTRTLVTELHRPAVAAFKRGTGSDKSLEIASNGENISQTQEGNLSNIKHTNTLFTPAVLVG